MCASTRLPEAIPLRNISAKTMLKHLSSFSHLLVCLSLFSQIRVRISCLGLFQQVMDELGIICSIDLLRITQRVRTHLSGFTRLWKTWSGLIVLIRIEIGMKVFICCCLQLESRAGVPRLSPFELVFGHSVRGPWNFSRKSYSHMMMFRLIFCNMFRTFGLNFRTHVRWLNQT